MMEKDRGSIGSSSMCEEVPEERTKCQKVGSCLYTNLLLILLIISLILGIGVGILIRAVDPEFGLDERRLLYFKFPGEILMRMLRMVIIPLIVSSLVSGLAMLDAKSSGKLGYRTIIYYFSTTFIAVILGIVLVTTIKPGNRSDDVGDGSEDDTPDPVNVADSFLDLFRNMLPDNIVEACFRQTKTFQVLKEDTQLNDTNHTITITWYDPEVRKVEGMNILGLVVFSIALGIIISRLGELGRPLTNVMLALAEATMVMVTLIIWYSPVGILFLVAGEIISMEDPASEMKALGWYLLTTISGMFIHGFIILPLIYFVVTRKNPYSFLLGVMQAVITAFGTASSAATLPITYNCLEENLNIDKRVTRFVLPVGATVNMDGTALYEAVGAIFIAQLEGIELTVAEIIAASITATFASIGAASVPGAGIITMVIVLESIGLPGDSIAKIIAVDWIVDRFRTAMNVEGDSFGAGVVAHLSRYDLEKEDNKVEEEGQEQYEHLASDKNTKTEMEEYTDIEPSSNKQNNAYHNMALEDDGYSNTAF